MANMSYVRFENTYRDLLDCKRALERLLTDPEDEPKLSKEEHQYAIRLGNLAEDVHELVDEYLAMRDEDEEDD